MKQHHTNTEGFSLPEILLSVAVLALLVVGLSGAYLLGEEGIVLSGRSDRALFLADEALEALRNIRDENYANLADGTYGLTLSGNQWVLSGTSSIIDDYTRSITIGTIDGDRKIATSTVTWTPNAQRTGTVSLVTQLTWWQATVGLNWANPTKQQSLNLTGTGALKVAVSGDYAYLVRGAGAGNFVVVDISDLNSPTVAASLSLTGTLNNIFVSGNHAYVTSSDNAGELRIVNIATPSSPAQVGVYNAPGNQDGEGIYVVGTTAYLGRASGSNNFNVVNVATPAAPATVGSVTLGGTGFEVWVSGSNAYVASGNNGAELQVVNISVPATPTLLGATNLAGNTDALAIAGSGNTVFVAQSSLLYAINITTPATPVSLGSYSSGATVYDVSLGNTYAFIGTASSTAELQVVDVSTPASMVLEGSYDATTTQLYQGVWYETLLDRVVAVTNNITEDFIIIQP